MAHTIARADDHFVVMDAAGNEVGWTSNERSAELLAKALDNDDASLSVRWRACGKCGVSCAPVGVDWPYWIDGNPACVACLVKAMSDDADQDTAPHGGSKLSDDDAARVAGVFNGNQA